MFPKYASKYAAIYVLQVGLPTKQVRLPSRFAYQVGLLTLCLKKWAFKVVKWAFLLVAIVLCQLGITESAKVCQVEVV